MRMRSVAHRCAASALLASFAFALVASDAVPQQSAYRRWLDTGPRSEVAAYLVFLRDEGVEGVVPAVSLLRTSRSWRSCGGQEFAVPPKSLWPNMPPTLRLIAQLRDAGLLDPALARSVYRDPAMNACAGGSARSRHLHNRAIDFDLPAQGDYVAKLCAFWREHGRAANMGLGFYTPTAIHIDTTGYRTWGTDHSRRTSLCMTESAIDGSRSR